MKQDKTPDCRRQDRIAPVIRVAEQVLAETYRGAIRLEMIESHLRVREIRRRLK